MKEYKEEILIDRPDCLRCHTSVKETDIIQMK